MKNHIVALHRLLYKDLILVKLTNTKYFKNISTLFKTIKGSTGFTALFFCNKALVHNSSINEHKNMKLKEIFMTCYERINCNLYYWGFRNNLQTNTIDFSLKKYLLRKGKILIFFGEIK